MADPTLQHSCPFCGCGAAVTETYVTCLSCHARGPLAETPSDALAQWNRRPGEALAEKIGAEKMQEACDLAVCRAQIAFAGEQPTDAEVACGGGTKRIALRDLRALDPETVLRG